MTRGPFFNNFLRLSLRGSRQASTVITFKTLAEGESGESGNNTMVAECK